jgi:hypothetical protein
MEQHGGAGIIIVIIILIITGTFTDVVRGVES